VQSKITDFINMIKDMAQRAVQAVNDIFKIRSPSRVMQLVGRNVVQGFNQGIEKTAIDVSRFANIFKANPNIDLRERIASEVYGAAEFRYQKLNDAQRDVVNKLTAQTRSMLNGTTSPSVAPSARAITPSVGTSGGGGIGVVNIYPPAGTPEETYQYIRRRLASDMQRQGGSSR
jgi:hypothetical protein